MTLELPETFWEMADVVQCKMRWDDEKAFGALLKICRRALLLGISAVDSERCAYWAGVDGDVATFYDALIQSRFIENGEIAIVRAHKAKGERRSKHARSMATARYQHADSTPEGSLQHAISNAPSKPPACTQHADSMLAAHIQHAESRALATALSLGEEGVNKSLFSIHISQANPDISENSEVSSVFDASENFTKHPSAGAREDPDDPEDDAMRSDRPLALKCVRRPLARKAADAIASAAAGEVRREILAQCAPSTEVRPPDAADWSPDQCDAWEETQMRAALSQNARALVVDRFGGRWACLEVRRVMAAFRSGFPGTPRAAIEEAFESKLYRRFQKRLYVEVEADRAAKANKKRAEPKHEQEIRS